MPKPLDLDRLADFAPEPPRSAAPAPQAVPSAPLRWPSRETALNDAQVSVKAPSAVIDRFRAMCEMNGRRTYAEMLVLLMDRWDEGR